MNISRRIRIILPLTILSLGLAVMIGAKDRGQASAKTPAWIKDANAALEKELTGTYGEAVGERARKGLAQVASLWREEDGDRDAYAAFVRTHFAGDQKTLDEMFARYQRLMEALSGHMNEISLEFRRQSDLEVGSLHAFDEIFAAYEPSAHVTDDFFQNKLAFVVLLNFPVTTLEERLNAGQKWSRRQWAEARLAQGFSKRIPAEVNQAVAAANAKADQYIAEYNIWMHHLLNDKGERLFTPGKRLLSHWNLRDELKAQYADADRGIERQRMIQRVMEHIVTQSIPEVVIDNPHVDWKPYTNEVAPAAVADSDIPKPKDAKITGEREPDTRYAVLLDTFKAARMVDPYSPSAPTHIARRFDENREIPEDRVEAMFVQMLTSPELAATARLIEKRLGRKLEPFDVWYNGFRPKGRYTEAELDEICRKHYPTAQAFEKDMPRLLEALGFSAERALYLASCISVDPARGSGHAWGAEMRTAKSHLRTRVGKDGMDYKGFNIAVHEMGHNVEQVLSLNEIDLWLLRGVPNTAFTEAMAFVFQARDLDLLGLESGGSGAEAEAFKTLDDFWGACEIAAVALVDMETWRWMYAHPDATPSQLNEAVVGISKKVWNQYYAPVMGKKDVVILGIYSHIIHSWLYLPDYPIGHLIAFQVEEQMRKAGAVGPECERMVATGNVAPDLWMVQATGSRVGADALLAATRRALSEL